MLIKNKFFLIFFILIILFSNIFAEKIRGDYSTKNIKGQNYYLKQCSNCHGDGSRGGNMASIREWKMIFSNNAKELISFHIENKESKELIQYIGSEKFKDERKKLLEFLQEFAYDSEHIPTCN